MPLQVLFLFLLVILPYLCPCIFINGTMVPTTQPPSDAESCHWANRSAVWQNVSSFSGFGDYSTTPQNDSLHPRCSVVWWTLAVWKSLSRDSCVLSGQEDVGLGNVPGDHIVLGMWGEQQCMWNFKAEGHSQSCFLWGGTSAAASSDAISGTSVCIWNVLLWPIRGQL